MARKTPRDEMDAKAARAAGLRAQGLDWATIASRLCCTYAHAQALVQRHRAALPGAEADTSRGRNRGGERYGRPEPAGPRPVHARWAGAWANRVAFRGVVGAVYLAVEAEAGVPVGDIHSDRRDAHIVEARALAIYAILAATGCSTTACGAAIGRHHTSVMHLRDRVEALIAKRDADTLAILSRIDGRLAERQSRQALEEA